jgi:ribosomal protein L37AE/L43A
MAETMTVEQQEEARMERLSEVGTGPDCPFCRKPRVVRSSYLRCNPCGKNWLDEEMHLPNYLNRNPSVARTEYARMVAQPSKPAVSGTGGADKDGR